MADLSKFEKMLERLINEDREGAQELFHEIVVEKSRTIYESLLEGDYEDDEEVDEEVDEDDDDVSEGDYKKKKDEDEEVDEDFNLDEFEVEADDDFMGGDATDDMIGDLGAEDGEDDAVDMDMDIDADGEGDVEDRVVDLEDALDELKAEFEKMMAGGEEGDDEEGYGDDEDDVEPEDDADFGDTVDGEEPEEEAYAFEAKKEKKDDKKADKKADKKTSGEEMREYVEKVSGGHGAEKKGSGDNGANTKSPVAGPNKMGTGTTQNIARSDEYSNGEHAGLGDLKAKDQDAGNINKPGAKATKQQRDVGKNWQKGDKESGAYTKPIVGGSKKK